MGNKCLWGHGELQLSNTADEAGKTALYDSVYVKCPEEINP